MKKKMLMVSIILSLLMVSACSDKTSKEAEPELDQATAETEVLEEEAVIEDEELVDMYPDENTEEEEYVLEDKEEYNRVFNLFPDDQLEASFKKMVGADLDIFRVTFQQIVPLPLEDENVFAFHGYIPGLEGIAEGVIVYDEEGNIWAATTEGELVNMYAVGNEVKKHHYVIEDWRQRFAGNSVVYKSGS